MRTIVLVLLVVVACSTSARAGETTVGVNLTALTGRTTTTNGTDTLPIGPLPTFELRTRSGAFRAQSEIAPPIAAPVDFNRSSGTLRLSGGTASIDAQLLGPIRPSLGVVRWIQTETSDAAQPFAKTRSTFIASGPSYGFAVLRRRVWTDANFSFAVAPHLHGTNVETRANVAREFQETLHGSQVDIRANVSGRRRLGTPVVGVRYFNFGAASDRDERLIGRSAGVFLTFGLRATVGG